MCPCRTRSCSRSVTSTSGGKDFEGAIRLYELGDADRERWAPMVDLLTGRPDQGRRAIALVERYLVSEAPKIEPGLAAAN